MSLRFNTTDEEHELISKIVDRAQAVYSDAGINLDRMGITMDITATHQSGNPLRLADWLAADDFNFGHDLFGIMRHLDRNTGELTDCFRPRFSA